MSAAMHRKIMGYFAYFRINNALTLYTKNVDKSGFSVDNVDNFEDLSTFLKNLTNMNCYPHSGNSRIQTQGMMDPFFLA